MRVPSAEGGPEARIQTPETERCQTPDHQTASPPGIRTHQVSLECMCLLAHPLTPSPPPGLPQGRRRGGGDEARATLEALRRLHACAARPAAAAGRKEDVVCVREPRQPPGGAAVCQRESRGSCTRAARESRGAGSPRLPAATAGSGRCGADLPKPAGRRLPTLRPSAPPAGSCSSARTPTAPPTWPPTCDRHGAIYYPFAAYAILVGLAQHCQHATAPFLRGAYIIKRSVPTSGHRDAARLASNVSCADCTAK